MRYTHHEVKKFFWTQKRALFKRELFSFMCVFSITGTNGANFSRFARMPNVPSALVYQGFRGLMIFAEMLNIHHFSINLELF